MGVPERAGAMASRVQAAVQSCSASPRTPLVQRGQGNRATYRERWWQSEQEEARREERVGLLSSSDLSLWKAGGKWGTRKLTSAAPPPPTRDTAGPAALKL